MSSGESDHDVSQSSGDGAPGAQEFHIVWSQAGMPDTIFDRKFPADWPQYLCQAQLSAKFWETLDLRVYRHQPQVRNTIWAARRAAKQAFKDMLAAHNRNHPNQ